MSQADPPADHEPKGAIPPYQASLIILGKIYLHGFLALAVVYLLAIVVFAILPAFEGIDSPVLRMTLAVLSILILPPLLGAMIRFAIYPIVGRHRSLAQFSRWDERLFSDLSQAKKKAQIVVVDWPSRELKTMGILTRSFVDESTGETMAAIYVPSISKALLSYVHVCRLSEVTFTNWTLNEWQLFHLSLGAFGPERIETRTERS